MNLIASRYTDLRVATVLGWHWERTETGRALLCPPSGKITYDPDGPAMQLVPSFSEEPEAWHAIVAPLYDARRMTMQLTEDAVVVTLDGVTVQAPTIPLAYCAALLAERLEQGGMTGTELNAAIAVFCGFELNAQGYPISRMADRSLLWPKDLVPNFTDDIAASMLLEDELAQHGLSEPYAIALARRVGYDRTPAGAFRLIHATPLERAEAALAVIEKLY